MVVAGVGAANDAGISASTLKEARAEEARKEWTIIADLNESPQPSLAPLPAALLGGKRLSSHAAQGSGRGVDAADEGDMSARKTALARQAALQERANLSSWIRNSFPLCIHTQPLTLPDSTAVAHVAISLAVLDSDKGNSVEARVARIPDKMKSELDELEERAFECLRYFYSCFPLSKRGTQERAGRLHEALSSLQRDCETKKEHLPRDNPECVHSTLGHTIQNVDRELTLTLHYRFRVLPQDIECHHSPIECPSSHVESSQSPVGRGVGRRKLQSGCDHTRTSQWMAASVQLMSSTLDARMGLCWGQGLGSIGMTLVHTSSSKYSPSRTDLWIWISRIKISKAHPRQPSTELVCVVIQTA